MAAASRHRAMFEYCSMVRGYEEPAECESEPVGDEREEGDALRPVRFIAWGRTYVVAEVIESWSQDRPWYIGNEPGTTRPIWYWRSEEHTSELQSPYVISYAVFCLKKK